MLSAVPQLHGHRFVLLVNVTRPHVVPRAEVAVPQGPNDRSRHDGMCLPQVATPLQGEYIIHTMKGMRFCFR